MLGPLCSELGKAVRKMDEFAADLEAVRLAHGFIMLLESQLNTAIGRPSCPGPC